MTTNSISTCNNRPVDNASDKSQSLQLLKASLKPKNNCAHGALYPAGVATAALLAGASYADAAVVTMSGPVVATTSGGAWDIDGDALTDITFGNTMGLGSSHFCIDSAGGGGGFMNDGVGGGAGGVVGLVPIEASTVVGPGAAGFAHFACYTLADINCNRVNAAGFRNFDPFDPTHFWPSAAPAAPALDFSGTIGFQFDNGGTINYGVANFVVEGLDGAGPAMTFTITDWAYEDSGAPILGSALVPEPNSAVLAFAGLAGLLFGTRRRRAA